MKACVKCGADLSQVGRTVITIAGEGCFGCVFPTLSPADKSAVTWHQQVAHRRSLSYGAVISLCVMEELSPAEAGMAIREHIRRRDAIRAQQHPAPMAGTDTVEGYQPPSAPAPAFSPGFAGAWMRPRGLFARLFARLVRGR